MLTNGVLLHQDNAPAHRSALAMAAAHQCGFELVEHPGVEIYVLSGLHVQPKLEKVQPQCMRAKPQLGRGPYIGLRWSTISLQGRSFDLKD